jgi:hypothetical protein
MRWHKRLVWMIVILLSAFSTALVSAQIPDGAEGRSYYVAFPVKITVDGLFTDWDHLPRQTVKSGPLVPEDPTKRGLLQFAAVADYEYLYLMIQVNDVNLITNQHGDKYWLEDSVEVYINGTGQRDLTSYVPGVVQLVFPAASMGLRIDETPIVGINSQDASAKAIVVETQNGYAIEAKIPFTSSVWTIEPSHDKRIGFQIELNGASELDRDMKLSWSTADQNNESTLNPSVFGELILWKIASDLPPVKTAVSIVATAVSEPPTMIVPPDPPVVMSSTPIVGPTAIIIPPPAETTPLLPTVILSTDTSTEEAAEPEVSETPTEEAAEPEITASAEATKPEATVEPGTEVAALPTATEGPAIPTETPAAPTANHFKVVGADIFDPEGNLFVAKGVNISGFNSVWSRKSVDDVNLINQCWNFNLVRVNNWMFKGRIEYDQFEVNNNLDEIVNAFTSRGIVVVFEAHDFIGNYYKNEDLDVLINWYVELATRYRDNPYVWFDIMNEPGGRGGIDVLQWVGMHGRVIEAIRGTGAENIIIVEGAFGGQDNRSPSPQPVSESAILQYSQDILNYNGNTFSNIVFSIHTWDLWNQGDEKLADYLDRAREQGIAMIVGEYGVRSDKDTREAAESTFNVTIPRDVGRVVWHWDGSDWNDLTVPGGGWLINDCANPTNLSWMGQKIWDDNHSSD